MLNFTKSADSSQPESIQIVRNGVEVRDSVRFEPASREWADNGLIRVRPASGQGKAQIEVVVNHNDLLNLSPIVYFAQLARQARLEEQQLEFWLAAELASNGQRVAPARLQIRIRHPPPPAPPRFDQERVQLRLQAPLPAQRTLLRIGAK